MTYEHRCRGGAPWSLRRRRVTGHHILQLLVGSNRTMHHGAVLRHRYKDAPCQFHERQRRGLARRVLQRAVRHGALPLCVGAPLATGGGTVLPLPSVGGAAELTRVLVGFGLRDRIRLDIAFASAAKAQEFLQRCARKYDEET